MQEGQLPMTQAERDRLATLKKAKKKLITQREAAEELYCPRRFMKGSARPWQRSTWGRSTASEVGKETVRKWMIRR
jgi:hypothetical protein